MKYEQVGKKRKGGTFLGALSFFLFFLVLLVAILIGGAYTYRDRLLLEFVRDQGPAAFGAEVLAVDSVVTRPVGQVSVELKGLVFRSSPAAPTLRAEKILLSTPNNLLDLYQLAFSGRPLQVKAQFIGLQIQATTGEDLETARSRQTNPLVSNDLASQALPFPIDLEVEVRDAQLQFGPQSKPISVKGLTGIIRTQLSTNTPARVLDVTSKGQLAFAVAVGSQTMLPVRTEWSLKAAPKLSSPTDVAITIQSLTISTLGLALKSSGTLKWPEQLVSIQASGATTDLGVLPLEKAESDALGISGRLKGAADVSLKLSGDLKSAILAEGLLRIKGGEFPLALDRNLPRPIQVRGPVQLDVDVPFKIAYDLANAKMKSLDLQLASFRADLTGAEVRIDGLLRKPAMLMMAASGQVTAGGETVELTKFEFRLSNLLMAWKGQVSLDPKRLSKLELALTLPDLSGWPALMPVLGTLERTATETSDDINRAKGSIGIRAKLELPLAAPDTLATNSRADFEVLNFDDLDLPVNFKSETSKFSSAGRVRGQLTASGQISLGAQTAKDKPLPITWSVRRANGSFDGRDLGILWPDKIVKAIQQELLVNFSASAASENRIRFEKLNFRLLDSSIDLAGTLARTENGDLSTDSTVSGRVALTQVYGMLPILRPLQAKIPSGTAGAQLKVSGTYLLAKGPSGSPLALNGRITLKAPNAVWLPTTEKTKIETSKASAAGQVGDAAIDTTETSIFTWPVVSKSNVSVDFQLGSVTMKSRTLKNLNLLASLGDGNMKGSLSIENAFGGPFNVSSFSILDLSRKPLEKLKASAVGQYKVVNLSALAEFMNPDWKSYVSGLATGDFKISLEPFSKSELSDAAIASGTINVKQGSFSTYPIDQLVIQKLFDFPLIAKIMGSKPKVASQNVNLSLNANYRFAKGRLNLKGFSALSPERNELNLDGWIQKDLVVDLMGLARLADSSIGGSFRAANSDRTGRLVVPIRITGSLKEPSIGIAEATVAEMAKKTVALETNKLKDNVKSQAGKVIDQKKKEAVDAVKAELKKRGLSF